ncbi:hypothetical protein AAMO2058_001287000 [Amorphochlora amoebiformis]
MTSQSWTELKKTANKYFRARQFDQACLLYGQAIDSLTLDSSKGTASPTQKGVLYSNRAQAYIMQKKFGDALDDCKECVRLDPGNEKGWLRGGTAFSGLEMWEEAKKWFEHVLSKDFKASQRCVSQAEGRLRVVRSKFHIFAAKNASTIKERSSVAISIQTEWDKSRKPGDLAYLLNAKWWKKLTKGVNPGPLDCDSLVYKSSTIDIFKRILPDCKGSFAVSEDLNTLHKTSIPIKHTLFTALKNSDKKDTSDGKKDITEKPLSPSVTETEIWTLKQGLESPRDFVCVSKALWRILHNWFAGDLPIWRPVISTGSKLMVETHPIAVTGALASGEGGPLQVICSKFSSVGCVKAVVCKHHVLTNSQTRVLQGERVLDDTMTLHASKIDHALPLVLQLRLPSGAWPGLDRTPLDDIKPVSTSSTNSGKLSRNSVERKNGDGGVNCSCFVCGGRRKKAMMRCGSCRKAYYCSAVCQRAHWPYHKTSCKNPALPARPWALVGLRNLGNTCYMNSALQCLRAVPELTNAFLTNRYKAQINKTNPLGKGGALALTYGEMMKSFVFSQNKVYAPRKFHIALSTLLSSFTRLRQHDANDLVSQLLDGLHEDLNLVIDKPYISLKDDDGRPDGEIAMEHWRNHLRRNQGILVDLFHGQYKSELICPDCDYHARKFDPFWSVTLPIPQRTLREVEVNVYPMVPLDFKSSRKQKKPIRVKIPVTARSTIGGLKDEIARIPDLSCASQGLVATLHRGRRFYKVFGDAKPISLINKSEVIHMYMTKCSSKDGRASLSPKIFQGRFLMRRTTQDLTNPTELFAVPFVLDFPSNASPNTLYHLASHALSRSAPSLLKLLEARQSKPDASLQDWPFQLSIVNPTGVRCGLKDKCPNRTIGCMGCAVPASVSGFISDFVRDRQTIALHWKDSTKWVNEREAIMYDVHHRRVTTSANSDFTLEDCFKTFCSLETLGASNSWYCSRCRNHVEASKKMVLWRLPSVLVLHLNRFKVSDLSLVGHRKNSTLVRFPLHDLDLSSFMWKGDVKKKERKEENKSAPLYDLVAVCNHFGGVNFGHYTSFVKARPGLVPEPKKAKTGPSQTAENSNSKPAEKKEKKGVDADKGSGQGCSDTCEWYHVDDESITPVEDLESMQSSSAYMLFYQRRNPGH